jgi:hypothetical protein
MHEHVEPKECKHELKYCKKCDTVYCEKCQKEWKQDTALRWSYTGGSKVFVRPIPHTASCTHN